ncbi:MAG: hypothetical protein ACRDKW_09430, partial [Actinomycetota bacterium]
RGAGTTGPLPGAHTNRFRRTALAAMLGAALALSAAPALADDAEDAEETGALDRDPEITFQAPTPAAGSALTGDQAVVVRADADSFAPLKAFRLTITADDPSIPPFQHVVAPSGFDETKPQTIRFEWKTGELTPYNGTYKLVAYARTCDFDDCTFDSSENTVTVAGLKVDNAPAVVQGVQATMQGPTPVVSWTPAREPDVRQYAVLRSLPSQPPQQVGVASGSSFNDPCSDAMPCPAGTTMTYQVAAIRRSAANPAGVRSQPSAAVSATTAPAPAAPASAPARPAAPVRVLPKPMDESFAPTLPYKMPDPAPAAEVAPVAPPVTAPVDNGTVDDIPAVGMVSALEQPRVPKVRYVAGMLMLLVLAMLVAKGGGLLLGAGPRERR